MEILLGGLSSLFFGVADFLGGEGARRASAASIVLWAGVISYPIILVTAVVVGGDAGISDYLLGLLAGSSGAIGLVALFAGLSRARAAVVAPVAAALSAVIPVIGGVIQGERPSAVAWTGVAIGIPAIVMCAWVEGGRRSHGGGFGYGVIAGAGFGGFAVIIDQTSPDSNLLPLITSRAATMLVMLVVGLAGGWALAGFRKMPRRVVIGNGLFDVSGSVALLLALRQGSLALAAVAASFYPAITVLLAKVVNAEHLRARQVIGIALTLVALTLIALG